MNTSDVLNKAADIIEERGWWDGGKGGTSPVGYCPMLAIEAEDNAVRNLAFDAFLIYLGAAPSDSLTVISGWNDAPERTAAEVIGALRACAVIEASRERESAEVSA